MADIFAESAGALAAAAGEGQIVATYDVVTLAEAKEYLRITDSSDDAWLAAMITAVTEQLERWASTQFVQRSTTDQMWGGKKHMYLRTYPVVSVTSITDPAANAVAAADYFVDKPTGILRHFGYWPTAVTATGYPVTWAVVYVAGWFANTAAVGADVKLAAKRMLAWHRDRPGGDVRSVSVGSLSVSYGGEAERNGVAVPLDVASLLGYYAGNRAAA